MYGDNLEKSISYLRNLGDFIYKLRQKLILDKLRNHEDLTPKLAMLGLKIPKELAGAKITYMKHPKTCGNNKLVVLYEPSGPKPKFLDLRIFCIRVCRKDETDPSGWRCELACLECGIDRGHLSCAISIRTRYDE